jgi:hypothetical protein
VRIDDNLYRTSSMSTRSSWFLAVVAIAGIADACGDAARTPPTAVPGPAPGPGVIEVVEGNPSLPVSGTDAFHVTRGDAGELGALFSTPTRVDVASLAHSESRVRQMSTSVDGKTVRVRWFFERDGEPATRMDVAINGRPAQVTRFQWMREGESFRLQQERRYYYEDGKATRRLVVTPVDSAPVDPAATTDDWRPLGQADGALLDEVEDTCENDPGCDSDGEWSEDFECPEGDDQVQGAALTLRVDEGTCEGPEELEGGDPECEDERNAALDASQEQYSTGLAAAAAIAANPVTCYWRSACRNAIRAHVEAARAAYAAWAEFWACDSNSSPSPAAAALGARD